MKSLTRVLIAMAMGVSLLLSLSGCCVDEPVIIVPEPEPTAPIIKGTITTNDRAALEGAVVTITSGETTYTVVTDADGNYSIQVEPGTYTITATKDGYTKKSDTITAENDAVTLWNALLTEPIIVSHEILVGKDTYIEMPVPPLVEEASTGDEDLLTAYIYFETTDIDDELIMEFYYDAQFVDDDTKTITRLMRLVNVNYYLASGDTLKKPITITVPTPAEPVRVQLNDEDIEYEFNQEANEVRIVTQQLGLLTFDYYVDIDEYHYGYQAVTFEQAYYDNFYGAGPLQVVNPKYRYFTGGYLTGNHVLINSLAAVYTGVPVKAEETAEYPLDITLPVGGKLALSGSQELYATEFDVADGLMHSLVVEYRGVTITAETYNRQHTGGSN